MPAEPIDLDRKKLETLLAALDEALERRGASAEIYVAGGARMVLGFKDDRTTTDVDVVFRRSEGPVKEAIAAVADEHGLDRTWVNAGMETSRPTAKDTGESPVYEGKHLTVIGASAEWMLAMKVMAFRDKDLGDIEILMEQVGVEQPEDIRALMEKVYVNEGPGAQSLINLRQEALEEWLRRGAVTREKTTGRRTEPPGTDPLPTKERGKSKVQIAMGGGAGIRMPADPPTQAKGSSKNGPKESHEKGEGQTR